jgi:hypothetical protein
LTDVSNGGVRGRVHEARSRSAVFDPSNGRRPIGASCAIRSIYRTADKTKAPAEAGAFIAAGFANRKGIFHARFPALP